MLQVHSVGVSHLTVASLITGRFVSLKFVSVLGTRIPGFTHQKAIYNMTEILKRTCPISLFSKNVVKSF